MPIDREAAKVILEQTKQGRQAIEARRNGAMFGEFVLQWDNGMCLSHEDRIMGFHAAKFFGSQDEATRYRIEFNIRNGHGDKPMPVRAFRAGELALEYCDQALDFIRAGLESAE